MIFLIKRNLILTTIILGGCDSDFKATIPPCAPDCPVIYEMKPIAAPPGETVEVFGANFKENMRFYFDDHPDPVKPNWFSLTHASFVVPDGQTGKQAMTIRYFEVAPGPSFYFLAEDYPLMTASPDLICQGTKFYNQEGELTEGTKPCGLPICREEGQAECVQLPKSEDVLAGVPFGAGGREFNGSAVAESYNECTADGATNCVATDDFPAAQKADLADKILSGQTVAGTGGNVTLPDVGDVEASVTYGVGGNGLTGTFAVPATTTVATGTDYGANGTEFNGSATLESHSNCAADGATDCVATATYTAALTTSLADKILSGQTVAGTVGNVTLPTVGDVEASVTYGIGGNGLTGTFAVPTTIATGTDYGASGTEF